MRLRSPAPTRCRCSRSSDRAAALRAAVGARAAAPRSGHADERYEVGASSFDQVLQPLCGRGDAGGEVICWLHQNSPQLHNDCAFRYRWSGHTSFAGILGDPLPCYPIALVGTSLVLVDRDREPSASGAHEGIAHETLYPPDETFDFSFVLLQEVEKRLRAFAGIASHDTSYSRCSSRERRRHVNDSRSLRVPHSPELLSLRLDVGHSDR